MTRDDLIGSITALAPSLAVHLHLDTDAELQTMLDGLRQQQADYAEMGFEDAAAG